MITRPTLRFLRASALIALLFSGLFASAQTTSSGNPTTTCGGVSFGTPPEPDGPCIGRGVCDDHGVNGLSVTFQLSDQYPNVLIMTFSLSQLQQLQPDQVNYFMSGSYAFQSNYCLSTDPVFAPLNLPANSWILTTSNSYVEVNGDVVTAYLAFSIVNG